MRGGAIARPTRPANRLGTSPDETYVLAQARLLDDKCCVIHWENIPSLTERFLGTSVRTRLVESDGAIHTCAGGTASFDMMLHIIREDFGEKVVAGICEQAVVDRVRRSADLQRMPFVPRAVERHPVVARLIERMQETPAHPVPAKTLLSDTGPTRRQIVRLFHNELGRPPGKFHMKLRLACAELLLPQTLRPVAEMPITCGFSSDSQFAKSYRDIDGSPPHEIGTQMSAGRLAKESGTASAT